MIVFFLAWSSGIDEQLARHYAHLFIRDPLTLFHEHIYEDDEQHTDHFEVHLSIHCFLTLFNQNIINSFLCFNCLPFPWIRII